MQITNATVTLTAEQMFYITRQFMVDHQEVAKILMSNPTGHCPFPFKCRKFPCEDRKLSCQGTLLDLKDNILYERA